MSTIYNAIVEKIKAEHEHYDLSYTAFRSLCHSQSLCEGLIQEILTAYTELAPSIAGNAPHTLPNCTECKSSDVRMGEITLNGKYWVQDLHCEACDVRFGRFNILSPGGK